MFWQNCFSVHLNFLFPSLGSGSLSNYSWEVNKYLVSCQTQEVLQIGNCFFSAKFRCYSQAMFYWISIYILTSPQSGLHSVSLNSSSHLSVVCMTLHAPCPLARLRMLCVPVSASDWHRGMRPGPADGLGGERPVMGTLYTAVHLYTVHAILRALATVQFNSDH